MISQSSSEWKVVDDTLYILPSVIVDIVFSYARERMFYLCDYSTPPYSEYENQYEIKEGLNDAPNNYYEWFMDHTDVRHKGFFVCTYKQYVHCDLSVKYESIYEIQIPIDAIIHSFNSCYDSDDDDGDNDGDAIYYEIDGFIINKMICPTGGKSRIEDNAIEIFDSEK
jgi:hypothetical protein